VMRLGAYAEVEIDPLLQFHLDKRNHVTQVAGPEGALDFFVLSASRRNDAAFLFRNKLAKTRVLAPPFVTKGYVNALRSAADLRRLVQDAFALKTTIQPVGEEVRPGVWVANGAKIHRSVRLVAPCYVGAFSKVRAGALITRGSAIEHHSVVDCGSVVEASTLLPLSCLGAGLDLTYSVVGSKKIVSVKYGAELEVEDATLVSAVPSTSMLRTLSHAAGLLTFVPRQVVRGFSGSKIRKTQLEAECPTGSFDPSAVTHSVGQDRPALTSGVVARARE
jgi:carbonic anhydrase/acetyltransferase-like protein (isoleucine patch superfamily)